MEYKQITEPFNQWLGQKQGEKSVKNLIKHGFDAHFVETKEEAGSLIESKVGEFESFGFAGSDTTRKIGLIEKLRDQGKTLYDHWEEGLAPEDGFRIRKKQSDCDCFLCSANAISMTGEIVNMDGVGNRTNAMSFGPKKVFIVAGMNKVTKDLDSALNRIHEVAAPMRAKSLGIETPCGKTGICGDCNDPMRLCRITTILHRRPMMTDISVVLINESLGF
ncbi:MAG: lactate utilization protein [Deltaproteobacteria bacterium]|jgi:L-lactate utilization protein LutB|nr:lactate utilization protein [Deltaproteobacteria bacterium]MBT4088011.1 lactate utilization protein [Deltaproteobacteria bacterium]MBT4268358.1 lactate utilization protein [Deltaproteobacteria bacterium]MBT4638979.1 lactate utilization protein [Deltaproteobacteria bacterium]MBT6501245.1 lactate utilization protein [Deltaproteobacteria bacterium]